MRFGPPELAMARSMGVPLFSNGQLIDPTGAGTAVGGSVSTVQGIDGAAYGLVPDTGADLTTQLQAAMTAARLAGKPVIVRPGKYIYSNLINNCGGGLVCTQGEAWFDNQDPIYKYTRLDFVSTDSSTLDGVHIENIKFTCSTRPDSGLTNGADENTAFIRMANVRNFKVWNCKFNHNWGGGVLMRSCRDGSVIGCEANDVFKDAFHITDDSYNIIRAFNVVRGAGDDAFPVVGYTAKGVMPVGITDIGNRVYGVRFARAFAYVGCRDVKNIGCIVDGRMPPSIPQQGPAAGGRYNTACALYIAAEAANGGTYGCENIEVVGFVGEYIAPGIDSAGVPLLTYQQIHISAGNGAGNPIKNVKIGATMRNGATRGLFVVGGGITQDIDADIIVEDNTDPGGLLSLTYTPGTGNQHAVEFQNTRNIKLKLRANKIAKGGVWCDANCSGYGDFDVSVGSISQVTASQNPINVVTASKFDVVDFKLNFETTPAASGIGSITRLIDNPNQGITRSCRVTGVDHAPAATNSINGWPMRVITPGTSPTSILNTTGRSLLFFVQGGTVSAIARAGVKGRAVAKAVTTGASGTVQIDGDFTDIYAAATVVTLFGARGVAIATATVASSALSGGVTTVTFDATGVNASFAAGMQMAVVNTMKTLQSRTNGIIEMPPESAVQVTYSSTPTCRVTDQTF